jgi:hypothetical protein
MATPNKEATDKRAVVMRAVEETTEKAAADKEAADKSTADEAVVMGATMGATGDSSAPDQVPSLVVGMKRVADPSGSTPPAK